MKRPLASKRPLGPFAQAGNINGVALVYTTENVDSIPSTPKLERMLDAAYKQARDQGRDEVVAADPEVEIAGSPRADVRGVKVNTQVTIMNLEQFNAVKEVTTEVIKDTDLEIKQIAVAVSNP